MDKYNNIRKINRVTFHLFLISFIVLIPALIAKDLIFIILLSALFVICLIIYLITNKKLNKIKNEFKSKCPICGKSVNIIEEELYFINGQIVDKMNFDTSIENDKKIIKTIKYQCLEDKFEYIEIITYYYDKFGSLKVLNKKDAINYQ